MAADADTAAAALRPAEIVGLLAEGDRLRTVAALVLGAGTVAEVAEAAGLGPRRAAVALSRLADAGLVEVDARGYRLREEELRLAARAEAAAQPGPDEHAGASREEARVLRAFVRDGRLTSIPASRGKRRVVLDRIVQAFEPGVRYPEAEVNRRLSRWHPDVAALRRYLVDEEMLDRAEGRYWRVGGTFLPGVPAPGLGGEAPGTGAAMAADENKATRPEPPAGDADADGDEQVTGRGIEAAAGPAAPAPPDPADDAGEAP